jgi:ketosteroid isomerase-like protein
MSRRGVTGRNLTIVGRSPDEVCRCGLAIFCATIQQALMKSRLFAILATVLSLFAIAHAETNKDKLKAEVAALEDAFCAMAKEKGLNAAFSHFAAPDVAFIDTDPRQWRGPAAVQTRMGQDRPGVSLTWSAYYTDVSDDGTLGYNYGRYEHRSPGPDGKETVRGGWFLSIWKRQPDGAWKYVMDTGVPDRPPAPPPKPAGN